MTWTPEADLTLTSKRELLAHYYDRYPLGVVIETGCWNGHGSCLQFTNRATVYVIEQDHERCELAWQHESWHVIEGDSATELPKLLALIDEPVFFWLDAHLVAEADEPNHSPLIEELAAIMVWPHARQSVVLIDDVRMMGREGWPVLDDITDLQADQWRQIVKDDIVRLTPW